MLIRSLEKIDFKRFLLCLIAAALSFSALIVLGWVTDGLNGTPIHILADTQDWFVSTPFLQVFALSVFPIALSAIGLYRYGRPTVGEVKRPREVKDAKRVVIAMLSSWNDEKLKLKPIEEIQRLDSSRLEDLVRKGNYQIGTVEPASWSAEPLLLGLLKHSDKLERCYLLVTEGKDGSLKNFEYIRDYLKVLLPEVSTDMVSIAENETDDLYAYYKQLENIKVNIRKARFKTSDVMIDTTSGPKPYSMAAAYSALHNDFTLQYVKSNRPKITFGDNNSEEKAVKVLEFKYEIRVPRAEY